MNINATLFGQMISFVVFVWFTMKFVWPHIIGAMEERKAKIADGLAAAERGKLDLELSRKRAKETLHDSKTQASEIIGHAQKRASEIVDEAKVAAREEGERILTAARAEIEQEANRTKEHLRKEVVALAMSGAEQILMHEVSATQHNELLEKLAAEL